MMHFTESEFYLNKRIALSVLALFSFFLLITCINVIHDWLPNEVSTSVFPAIRAPNITYHLQDISSWHLLGNGLNPGDLPETNLQLILQGILSSTESAQASVIIAQPGKPGEVYRPGDLLPGGAILDKVLLDNVLILNHGRLEVLPLVRAKLQFVPVAPSMWSS